MTGVWPTRISVAWTASVDDVGSQVWYTLLVNGSPYGGDMIGYRSALVLDRSPATTYTFKVTVRDFFGNTNQSNVVTVTTPAATDYDAADGADEPAPLAGEPPRPRSGWTGISRRTTPIRSPRSCTTST